MAGVPPPPPPPSAPPPPPGQGPEDREEARFNTRMLAILGSFITASLDRRLSPNNLHNRGRALNYPNTCDSSVWTCGGSAKPAWSPGAPSS